MMTIKIKVNLMHGLNNLKSKIMKNIHVLPTDKPSRVHFDCKLFISTNPQISREINSIVEGRNIYITNSEEIKEGDWVFLLSNEIYKMSNTDMIHYLESESKSTKKIILTTDQDLIKDGVQAIDDEFLEWIVKNPSCEEVEIESEVTKNGVWTDLKGYVELPTIHSIKYKIIIPKEEPKQETLEEAATIYAHRSFVWPLNKQGEKQSIPPGQLVPPGYAKHQKVATKHFTNGAKWQSEISYSEEEMRECYEFAIENVQLGRNGYEWVTFNEWFEQFKKK